MAKRVSKTEVSRRSEVRRIFQKLYANGTAAEVLTFHEWLSANSPDLLPQTPGGNSYQLLKADLADLIQERRTAKPSARKRQS
jgi:hypothetical protein